MITQIQAVCDLSRYPAKVAVRIEHFVNNLDILAVEFDELVRAALMVGLITSPVFAGAAFLFVLVSSNGIDAHDCLEWLADSNYAH